MEWLGQPILHTQKRKMFLKVKEQEKITANNIFANVLAPVYYQFFLSLSFSFSLRVQEVQKLGVELSGSRQRLEEAQRAEGRARAEAAGLAEGLSRAQRQLHLTR